MKQSIIALVGLFTFALSLLASPNALAVSTGAKPLRHKYNVSHVMTWQHTELLAASEKGILGLQVNNAGPNAIKLAFGAAGSEVDQIIVGSNQDTAFMPVAGAYGVRLSVIALDGPAETGELDVNVFYN